MDYLGLILVLWFCVCLCLAAWCFGLLVGMLTLLVLLLYYVLDGGFVGACVVGLLCCCVVIWCWFNGCECVGVVAVGLSFCLV